MSRFCKSNIVDIVSRRFRQFENGPDEESEITDFDLEDARSALQNIAQKLSNSSYSSSQCSSQH